MAPVHGFRRWLGIRLPTPYTIGKVNLYLLPGDPVTLIDCGPDTPECRESLTAALAEHGLKPGDVERVIVTHAHHDHIGLASWIQEEGGASVYLHPADSPKLDHLRHFIQDRTSLMRQAGLPPEAVERAEQAGLRIAAHFSGRGLKWRPLADGASLPWGKRRLRALHTPGHSRGHVILWEEQEGVLFGADLLLHHISPAPILELERGGGRRTAAATEAADAGGEADHAPVLAEFLASLDRAEELSPGVTRVLCGHGPEYSDLRERIRQLREHHEQFLDRLLRLLRKRPGREATVAELSRGLFRGLKGIDIFLAASEIMAHLDYLTERGELQVEKAQGAWRYRAA